MANVLVNGGKIRQLRELRALTQERLSMMAKVGPRTIQRIESKGSGSLDSIRLIAAALEVEVSELMTVSDSAKGLGHGTNAVDVVHETGLSQKQLEATGNSGRSSVLNEVSALWDRLGDTIVILFGVEHDIAPRRKVSHDPHDFRSAICLYEYLLTRYKTKKVLLFESTPPEAWEPLVDAGADIVTIGGFVTNPQFTLIQSHLKNTLRLKMGQICDTSTRRVFSLQVHGQSTQDVFVREPQLLELHSLNDISKDYGLISYARIKWQGKTRRIISFAGVRGLGTYAAVLHAIGDGNTLPSITLDCLRDEDHIEFVVSIRASKGRIGSNSQVVEIDVNGCQVYLDPNGESEQCRLSSACKDCSHGEGATQLVQVELKRAQRRTHRQERLSGIHTVVFFLGMCVVFETASHCTVDPQVLDVLRQMEGRGYRLVLVSNDPEVFHLNKVEKMVVNRNGCTNLEIVEGALAETPARTLGRLMNKHGRDATDAAAYLVIGHRLEEISGAKALGMTTVCLRRGEEIDMFDHDIVLHMSDRSIDQVDQILEVLP